ncbi:MAG TPA: dienelactone hydrolase [Acidimicrobiaceae bacterium]|nr:dienelactone hydrolase [Acidimicrobiaceae bacterium]
MGEIVTFKSNGHTCNGYIAGSGPGVLVIQEWWGLVPHITEVVDRLAAEGFTALAPDLYHGESSTEPDGAGKLMMALNLEQAVKDLSGAVDLLQERSGGGKIGVVGFCMGGALAIVAAAKRGDAVAACAPYYGVIGWPSIQVDYSAISGRVVGEYAESDDFAGPEAVRAQEAAMREAGVDVAMHIHAGAQHAFFNDTRPDVYHAAAASEAWARTLDLFRATL